MRRFRSLWVLATGGALIATVILVFFVSRSPASSERDSPTPHSADGWEVRAPDGAFDAEVAPHVAVTPSDDEFVTDLGVTRGLVMNVTADHQPREAVTVLVPYEPDDVPDGSVPAVFYYDTDLELWVPIPTEVSADGRLSAKAEHFTMFTGGLLTWAGATLRSGAESAAGWTDWLTYQVASGVGARSVEPDCGPKPPWVTTLEYTRDPAFPLNGAVFACVEQAEGAADHARLRIAVNRAYALTFTSTTPASTARILPSASLDDALAQAFVHQFELEPGTYVAPGTSTLVLDLPRGETSGVTINASITPESALIDLLVKTFSATKTFASGGPTARLEAMECGLAVIRAASDTLSANSVAGTWVSLVNDCLSGTQWEALARPVGVGLQLGQAGQSLWDGGRDVVDGVTVELTWPQPAALLAEDPDSLSGTWTAQDLWYDIVLTLSGMSGGTLTYYDSDGGVRCAETVGPFTVTDGGFEAQTTVSSDSERCVNGRVLLVPSRAGPMWGRTTGWWREYVMFVRDVPSDAWAEEVDAALVVGTWTGAITTTEDGVQHRVQADIRLDDDRLVADVTYPELGCSMTYRDAGQGSGYRSSVELYEVDATTPGGVCAWGPPRAWLLPNGQLAILDDDWGMYWGVLER